MSLLSVISAFSRRLRRGEPPPDAAVVRGLELRVASDLFDKVRRHVEDFSRGEEGGFLLCGLSSLPDRDVLLAREWVRIPERAMSRGTHGSVLSWSADFNSEILERALRTGTAPVLVHSHGRPRPGFSGDDQRKERALFPAMSRLLGGPLTGTLLLGQGDAVGSFWADGARSHEFRRLVVVESPIESWASGSLPPPPTRRRLARQSGAIGQGSDAKLATARVAVVGISGGGSHVVQQLAHQGVGRLIVFDDDVVDETNLGRVVGAVATDVDITEKTELARRIAHGVDPKIEVVEVRERFPSTISIEALKEADVVVSCVDTFRAREAINAFCRRHLLPLVDIGTAIRTANERLVRADGQLIVALPGKPCLRCWFVTNAVLEAEERARPAGYDDNPDAGDPQVVSMNGVLASEACNSVLDLITGYSNGARGHVFWQYEGRSGSLEPCEVPPARSDCPACAEEGFGDPSSAPT